MAAIFASESPYAASGKVAPEIAVAAMMIILRIQAYRRSRRVEEGLSDELNRQHISVAQSERFNAFHHLQPQPIRMICRTLTMTYHPPKAPLAPTMVMEWIWRSRPTKFIPRLHLQSSGRSGLTKRCACPTGCRPSPLIQPDPAAATASPPQQGQSRRTGLRHSTVKAAPPPSPDAGRARIGLRHINRAAAHAHSSVFAIVAHASLSAQALPAG